MSDKSTIALLEKIQSRASAPMFLSSLFPSPPDAYHTSEAVEFDIEREDEDVAIVVKDLSTGANIIESDIYTNKKLLPAIYKEKGVVNVYDLLGRQAGMNPFESPQFGAAAMNKALTLIEKASKKIRRAVELQASQVLQTGKLSLTDSAGTARFTLDYVPKTTHFAEAGTTWPVTPTSGMEVNTATTAYADVASMCQVIRRDGKKRVTKLLFGDAAFDAWLLDYRVKNRLVPFAFGDSNLNPNGTGRLSPTDGPEDGTFQGYVRIGPEKVEMWTYSGFYKAPNGGAHTSYINTNNVIFICETAKRITSWGAIPRLAPPDARALPFMPNRAALPGVGIDLNLNAWIEADGENLWVSAGARPLVIPKEIDCLGCLTAIH